MKKEFSVYLDLVRFTAAALVVVWHSNNRNLIAEVLPMSAYGHSAVIVFFVLSGFVIAYVTDTKERTLRDYAVSRLGRIYSVAITAVVLTLVLDQIGQRLGPDFYAGNTTHDFFLIRFVASLLFLNEIWGISIATYSNLPYWSLSYEVWYYILFAAVAFAHGTRRVLLLLAICLFLGPKILLLAPIWWLGVLLYRTPLTGLPESAGWALFAASLGLVALFHVYGLDARLSWWLKGMLGEHLWTQLAYSKHFLSDYVLAVLIAMNFVGFRAISHRFARVFSVLGGGIVFLAGFTFSLYLFHQPLLLFFAAAIDGDPQRPWFYLQVMTCVTLSVLLLGSLTEKRKRFFRRQAARAVDLAVRRSRWTTASAESRP